MLKILLASHGPLAQAIKTTGEFLMGENENVQCICAYVDEESQNLEMMIEQWNKSRNSEDTWMVMTDLFGGSVNNEFLQLLSRENFYLISGMNLPLLLSAWTKTWMEEEFTKDDFEQIVQEARESIVFCNELAENVCTQDDDF